MAEVKTTAIVDLYDGANHNYPGAEASGETDNDGRLARVNIYQGSDIIASFDAGDVKSFYTEKEDEEADEMPDAIGGTAA